MPITKYDDIVAGIGSGTVTQEMTRCVGSINSRNGPKVLWSEPASQPTTTTGILCNANTDLYAPWFPLPAGAADTLVLDWWATDRGSIVTPPGSLSGVHVVCLCDMLWKGNVTDTVYGGGYQDYPFTPPALTRYTSGDGVYPLVWANPYVSGMGSTNFSVGVWGTDNLGRTNQLCGNITVKDGASSGAGDRGSLWTPGPLWVPPPIGAGGMRSVTNLRLVSDSTTATNAGIVVALVKPLAFLPVYTNAESRRTFSEACSSILRLPLGSSGDKPCLFGIRMSGVSANVAQPQLEFLLANA